MTLATHCRKEVLVTLALSTWSVACARHHDPSVSPTAMPPLSDAAPVAIEPLRAMRDADAQRASDGEAHVDATAPKAPKTKTTWVEDVRRQRWADAAAKLDVLPKAEQDSPEIRYARARVAASLNDLAGAASRLDGLDASLPLLAGDIERRLAEARLVAGPYEKAAEYFGAHANPGSLLAPSHPLLGEELLVRAQILADAGRTDDALKALDRVAGAPPPKVPHLTELRLRGDILYRTRGRALEASHVLDESAAAGGSHSLEDAFHAARALARADSDDEAARRLAIIAKSHPGTHWGDEAQYFVPYLAMLHGKWREAAAGFDEYAKAYPKGVERRDAEHAGALAHLMNEDYTKARRLFEEVAAEESDPLAAVRARELAALAALREGDRLHAVAGWTAILRTYPLSWAALAARARLDEMHAPVVPWVEPRTYGGVLPPMIVKLPPPVDVLHRLGLDADAETALHEREGVVFGAAPPGRGLEALCAAYGMLGRAKRRYHLISQIPVDALRTEPGPSNRWAWECAYPMPFAEDMKDDLAPLAPHDRSSGGADEILAYAVMRQESNFDPDAISPAHAVGLMQLLPETARVVAGELQLPYDEVRLTQPSFNVALGTRYLVDLGEKFTRSPARLPLIVAAYNAGDEAVTRWLSRVPKMDIDEFVERIPYVETRGYVSRVMGNWAHYEYLLHGDSGVPPLKLALAN